MVKKQVDTSDPFASDAGNNVPSPQEVDESGYGAVNIGASARREKIKNVDIFSIYPDPMQPRRAIPTVVRNQCRTGLDDMGKLFECWAAVANIDVEFWLTDDSDYERPELKNREQIMLTDLIDLAISIREDGLSNPITVVRDGNSYHIETGERRWMAYNLLHVYDTNAEMDKWKKIPIRDIGKFNVWRQAAENGSRENLNAIEKARQLALLLMDLHGVENFYPLEHFDDERDFYAQVQSGEDYRVPHGKNKLIVSAMGLKSGDQVRQIRMILRDPSDFWHEADEKGLTEGEVRERRKNGYSVTRVTESSSNLPKNPLKPPKTRITFNKIWRALDDGVGAVTRDDINELRQWLDNLEGNLD